MSIIKAAAASIVAINNTVAVYARKSVYRDNSISVETQVDTCKREIGDRQYKVYSDNGYSGKDTDRPGFQQMVKDIKAGIIKTVIVYKLDRISRSVLDFAELMQLFKEYGVEFISTVEKFDTSTPMGKAMLNICIVFAELERESIQQRVTDAYASRSSKGFFMGGKTPYGYDRVPCTIDGVKTSMYVINENEAEDIRLIYELYSKPEATLGSVLRELKEKGINQNRRGHWWNTSRLSEIMRNPIYTVNDLNLYRFYKSKGSNLKNTSEEYDGEHSLYLFSGENTNRKTWDLSGQNIVIAPHKGFIPSDIWLFCRKKILANHQVKTCKAKNSFLAGKLKCGNCGYGLAIRKSQRAGREPVRYFVDMGWTEHRCCPVKLSALRADEIEALVVERITDKVNELNIHPKQERSNAILESIVTLEGRIEGLKSQIDGLLDMLCGNDISPITVKHVNERIDKLGREQVEAEQQLAKLQSDVGGQSETEQQALYNVMSHWNELTFDDKRAVVELLIEKIVVTPEKLEFIWKV